jgi:sucrose-6-phosphate hydrolase SacC (GH32 family)
MCVFIILGHPYTAIFSESAVETQLSSKKKKKQKVDIFNNKQVMELFRNSGTTVYRPNIFCCDRNGAL